MSETEKKAEKLDALVSNAPPTPDNVSGSTQADMQNLLKDGRLKDVLDGQGSPIPGNFASADTLLGEGLDKQKVIETPVIGNDQPSEKQPTTIEAPKDAGPKTEKYANGSVAEIDKNGHLEKLTYSNGQGYKYEWLKDQLVSIDSFDKNGNVKPWLEKNNDGTWTQFDEKNDQIVNADLSVNSQGDMKWTHKAGEFHKDGDVEIFRMDQSQTTISKADHTWTTKYPDGEERKIVFDERTNNPCEYWAPKPHSSHWKSEDGLTWHQIGKDGKPLNKPPMIGKFITYDESGGFTFLNLGDKNPHITAYDSTGSYIKPTEHDTAANMVAGMVEQYANKRQSSGHAIAKEQFTNDSKDQSLSVDDRIAAKVLAKLVEDYEAKNIRPAGDGTLDIVAAFESLVKRAEEGDTTVNEHIAASMAQEEEAKEINDVS